VPTLCSHIPAGQARGAPAQLQGPCHPTCRRLLAVPRVQPTPHSSSNARPQQAVQGAAACAGYDGREASRHASSPYKHGRSQPLFTRPRSWGLLPHGLLPLLLLLPYGPNPWNERSPTQRNASGHGLDQLRRRRWRRRREECVDGAAALAAAVLGAATFGPSPPMSPPSAARRARHLAYAGGAVQLATAHRPARSRRIPGPLTPASGAW